VEPRPSAAVLLLRGRSPWEVLMIRRPGGAEFAPGAFVYPGGSVHADDLVFGDERRAAAVRELFEETGILLARGRTRFAGPREQARLAGLLESGGAWPEALASLGLRLALDRLAFLTRWITPEPLRRRFDTSFYLARLPAGQAVRPQPGEVVDWRWVEPRQALGDDSLNLVHATRRIMESVAREPDAGRLVARARRRQPGPPVLPRLVPAGEGWQVVDDYELA
jgi:8-oxo-dGTP pyrophosphatase MutT (NUDIX family)